MNRAAIPAMLRERLESARKPIDLKREEHEREVEALSARWDQQLTPAVRSGRRATLDALRERLLERNYINNLLATIDREARRHLESRAGELTWVKS